MAQASMTASGVARMVATVGDPDEKLSVITVRLPKADYEQLKIEATNERVSLNCLCVHRLLRRKIVLEQNKPEVKPEHATAGNGFENL